MEAVISLAHYSILGILLQGDHDEISPSVIIPLSVIDKQNGGRATGGSLMKYLVGYEVRVTTDESAELAEQSTSL
jgi:hypothetical protein